MQLRFDFKGHIELKELFDAYFDCRKNKRKTMNALKFELNYEEELIQLWKEINEGTYRIGRSIAFIVDKPVKREIFAADFRDRVVHHLIINKLNSLFEKEFIFDSYSCRTGKGTLFGVKRLNRFIRACSENYTRDAYILKLDIRGFFMSINRNILFMQLEKFVHAKYQGQDRDLLIELIHAVVMNDCIQGCCIKSPLWKWDKLPADKSLFSRQGQGLPIGNLTSQIFANFYLTPFDHFMKSVLKLKYYGRYVDDFCVVHHDKHFLQNLIFHIESFLKEELKLTLHPKKQWIVHFEKGVQFIGAYLLPHRIYISRRTKGNFYCLIERWNRIVRSRPGKDKLSVQEQNQLLASANSYLGFMRHYKTYRLRKKMLYRLSAKIDKYMIPAKKYTKLKRLD
jgi:hypothetical protein